MAVRKELLAIMACPGCKGSLADEGQTLLCEECGVRYPVSDGIPVMLPEAAIRPGEAE
ncbi:Trm112 family protein [bacterium]|nr:Trm112 family protein [bacterium]